MITATNCASADVCRPSPRGDGRHHNPLVWLRDTLTQWTVCAGERRQVRPCVDLWANQPADVCCVLLREKRPQFTQRSVQTKQSRRREIWEAAEESGKKGKVKSKKKRDGWWWNEGQDDLKRKEDRSLKRWERWQVKKKDERMTITVQARTMKITGQEQRGRMTGKVRKGRWVEGRIMMSKEEKRMKKRWNDDKKRGRKEGRI